MLARDVMTTKVITASPDDDVMEIARLLLDHHISAVPVMDEDRHVLGMVSEADLMRRAKEDVPHSWWLSMLTDKTAEFLRTSGTRARDVMTRDVTTINDDVPISEIAQLLEAGGIKRVPVISEGRLVGIVSRANVLQGLAVMAPRLARNNQMDDRAIRESIIELLEERTSVDLHAVNIIVRDGDVYLWGVVDSEEDGAALRAAAESVAGVGRVHDFVNSIPRVIHSVI